MRLLYKVTLFFLLITAIVFSIGGIITYNIFQREIKFETDRYLEDRYRSMEANYANGDNLAFVDSKVTLDTLLVRPAKIGNESISFSDTIVMHPNLRRLENNRKFSIYEEMSDNYVRITIHDVIVESDDIYDGAFQAQTRLFTILGVVMVLGSFFVGRWLFKPFDRTMVKIKNFNIKDLKVLDLGKTTTKEFDQLNSFIEQMTKKVIDDYKSLKEFTENASHEFQTPLAIAKGKIELLMQHQDLKDNQLKLIQSCYQAINHLSKVGHSLALLTRIENQEYNDLQIVELRSLLQDVMDGFVELIQLKNISLEHDLQNEIVVKNDPTLMRIFMNNLLQNAVRYNNENGTIKLSITDNVLVFANTGDALNNPPDRMFMRFKKDKQSSSTTGLGLAIVKKICDLGGYSIQYDYTEGWHRITVDFKTALKS
jgi:signal transduction histidine kinase